ncbi:M23 family metallopeptidase [Megalodesulfovibrio gigas]|uniref:Putative peptidase M23 n=1 Tax=Megalodesulfovibrio gigas (strain ATCC 19364 / DSM 1382 / NCIMB 9332 / VKM B-1759) TaxID=1121448 RepID=T2G7T3_MEGG1|nr:peptidoglycan DD-metalloendopeptidase family protein [Megalodesulfovibrio gigas]AGW12191.1 putative peptidase M23 [Megalodesulfovibrio gigas DSM 1382 = ATCC 19364]
MLFRKYHVVIFKDNQGTCSKLRLHSWMFFLLGGLFVLLVVGNVVFLRSLHGVKFMEQSVEAAQKKVKAQETQMLALSGKINALEKDLTRIRDFDSQLRVMMNLDSQVEAVGSVGNPKAEDFAEKAALLRQERLARRMHDFLDSLTTDAQLELVRQEQIIDALRGNLEQLASIPSIWPTQGWVTSAFGPRRSPFTGRNEFHQGVDISNKIGTPIYAPAKGVVTFAANDAANGKTLVVQHGGGLVTRYSHLQDFNVKVGDKTERGQLIASMGNTGTSTGPHLHYEVRLNGAPVNPMRYILE